MVTGFCGSGAMVVAVPGEVCDGEAVPGELLDEGRSEAASWAVPGPPVPLAVRVEPPVHPARKVSDSRATRTGRTACLDGFTGGTLESIDPTGEITQARRS
jgi:hypothetical protein